MAWTNETKDWDYHKPLHRINSPSYRRRGQADGRGYLRGCHSEDDGPNDSLLGEMIKGLARTLPGPLLDFGCGAGALICALRQHGIDAYGLELDNDRIRNSLLDPARPFITLYDGVLPSSFVDRQFRSVICSEVLEHVQDPKVALAGLSRLAPQALLTVPWEPWFQLANLARGKYLPTLGNHPEHLHRWTMGGFAKLAASNYEQVHVETMFPWTIYLGRAR